MRERLSFFNYF